MNGWSEMTVKEVFNSLIQSFQEAQGTSKKQIKTIDFEGRIIAKLGNPRKYNELGGYKEFYKQMEFLINEGMLKRVKKPKSNIKTPSLDVTYWLLPKYKENKWSNEDIARLMRYVDLSFYMKHKKHQTDNEMKMVERIHDFMETKNKSQIINREERSLLLFSNINLPNNIEAEKFLSSSEGTALINKLKINLDDLSCKIVREPFTYWKNVNSHNKYNVLIVEGLATYNTIKEILINCHPWHFGPTPQFLIWGEGYRIESTIDYLNELVSDITQLDIHYLGDMDFEGFNIYFNLKQKNHYLNIKLAYPFYKFLSRHSTRYATNVEKAQRISQEVMNHLNEELNEFKEVLDTVQMLWSDKKRIAQEVINLETVFSREVF